MARTILILAANPKDTPRLRLDEEVREIDNGLRRARKRDEFNLKQLWAPRPKDIRRAMLDYKPNIVHFCGHGEGAEGIAFEDETGHTRLVRAEVLAEFFELFANYVECVFLNACYSEIQARAIAQHINYVIGVKEGIGDATAIRFAVAFYDALGAGESFEFAYKLARNAIQWADIPENLTPVLIKSEKVDLQPQGKINFPRNGDLVSRLFRARGAVDGLPSGWHLYLAVEIGDLIWPKEPEVIIEGTSWSGEVCEGGSPPNGRFSLSLYAVNQEGHRRIMKWLENGRRTGHYPGLREIEGSRRLHQINLQLED